MKYEEFGGGILLRLEPGEKAPPGAIFLVAGQAVQAYLSNSQSPHEAVTTANELLKNKKEQN
jgi:hypothetical protein